MIQSTIADLTALRRRLHAHPELSGQESETARLVAGELRRLSPDQLLTALGGTGLAAVFGGDASGPTLLFRAELDALPIAETNTFAHRSRREHVSHKCGHDGHMAILLGLARELARRRPARGRVVLLFQPAEETGEGARAVLSDERFALIRPDRAFALHNLPGYPLGAVVTKAGPFTADVRSLIIRLHGKTAHAAEPEHGVNPAGAVAELLRLSEQMAQPDPGRADFALITPVFATLGEPAYGVSAGYGEVHLTLRRWSAAAMDELAAGLLRQCGEIARRHRLGLETTWTNSFHANTNDEGAVELVRQAARRLGLPLVEREHPIKWGEDFGAFTQQFPGAMFGLGAGENTPALHNPDYDFPDEIIGAGAGLFHAIVEQLLN